MAATTTEQLVPKGYEGNAPEIDKQFAVKAVEQADIYWNLLEAIEPSRIKLTKHDDELYSTFKEAFPEYFEDLDMIRKIDEAKLKSTENKVRWRKWLKRWEKDISDYNFGTLLRSDASGEFTEQNAIFALRAQALAFEIARIRHGMNDWILPHAKKEKKKVANGASH